MKICYFFLWQLNTSRELGDCLDSITKETEKIGFIETTIATSGADRILSDAMADSEVSPMILSQDYNIIFTNNSLVENSGGMNVYAQVAIRYINVVNNLLSVNISELQMSQQTSNSSGR